MVVDDIHKIATSLSPNTAHKDCSYVSFSMPSRRTTSKATNGNFLTQRLNERILQRCYSRSSSIHNRHSLQFVREDQQKLGLNATASAVRNAVTRLARRRPCGWLSGAKMLIIPDMVAPLTVNLGLALLRPRRNRLRRH